MMIPFRQSLTRTLLASGALLALGLAAAQAQDGGVAAPTPASSDVIETVAAVVYGVSANDLLNVRATASPIGLVLARIPNGTIVTRLECSMSRSAEWCRIEVPDLDGLVGWAPSRYLLSPRDDEDVVEAPAAPPRPVVVDPSQVTIGILPDPLPMPEDPLADLASGGLAGGTDIQTVLLAPAPGGPPTLDAAREAAKVEGAAAELALAFATRTDPASSEVYSAFGAEAAPGAGAAGTTSETALAVPVPSPRPSRADETEAVPAEAVAALSPADTATAQEPAAPAGQVAPAAGEPEAPVAVEPPATLPAPEASASAAPDVAPAAEPPAVPAPAQQPAAALALPPAASGDPAPASPVVPEPEAAGTSPAPAATASSEPADGPDETGEAPRTLREQLAALLPAWSRPPAADGAEPVPETQPGDATPAGPAAAASDGGTAEAAAAPASVESTDQMAAVRPAEPSAGAAVPSAAGAETGSARSGDEADAAGTPPAVDQAAAVPPPSDGAATAVAEAATAEPPAAVPAPMPIAPRPGDEPRRVDTVAQARPVEPTQPAPPPAGGETAEVPCARYVGQPMTRCEVRILRLGPNDADITIFWPDGGERLIRFRGGQPDGTNTRGEFRFTREAELNLIRIGSGERFEILDAVPFAEQTAADPIGPDDPAVSLPAAAPLACRNVGSHSVAGR